MSKVKVNYELNKNKYETIGIKNRNRLTFMENDIKVNFILNEYIMIIRENAEYKIDMNFENKTCKYLLKGYNEVDLDMKLIASKIDKNNIYLKYKLNDELFELKLNYEVIE